MAEYIVESGIVESGIILNSEDLMNVLSGGTADITTVNSGGELFIDSGGSATEIMENGGYVYFEDGADATFAPNTFSGLVLHKATLHSGTTANYVVLNKGYMHIYSAGIANGIVVSAGKLEIDSGGTATNIAWTPCQGNIYVEDGGYATFASEFHGVYYAIGDQEVLNVDTIDSRKIDTEMYVMTNGIANNTSVNGGKLYVYSGGTANNTVLKGKGYLYVYSGGQVNSTVVSSGCYFHVSRDATANSTTIGFGGYLHVSRGGRANSTVICSSGVFYINSDGMANFTTITGGSMFVSGGLAYDTVMESGSMNVYSGGTAVYTDISFANLTVSSGGVAVATAVVEGNVYVLSGGIASAVAVSSNGSVFVSNGGEIKSTIINSDGRLYVSNEGKADDTTINTFGRLFIQSGAMARGVTVNSSGSMIISSGGTLTGEIICYKGGLVSADDAATINFDLTRERPRNVALINNLEAIQGAPHYTITVNPDVQEAGIYLLARGASQFSRTISLLNADGTTFGFLSINQSMELSGTNYKLNLSEGVLSLTVGESQAPSVKTSTGIQVESGSTRSVGSDEFFSKTTVLSGGMLQILSGGLADDITVLEGGSIQFASGGTATGIEAASDTYLGFAVANNTRITGTSDGSVFQFVDGRISGYVINSGYLDVLDGGTANGVTVNPNGVLRVSSGGTATDIAWTPCEGQIFIDEGATATFVSEYSGVYYGSDNKLVSHVASLDSMVLDTASAYVMSGGNAESASVKVGGVLWVSSGGTATDIAWTPCEGQVFIDEGATATFVSEYSGVYHGSNGKLVSHAASLDSMLLDTASAYVMSGGTATRTTIQSGGMMEIRSGGIAFGADICSGKLIVSSSGLASGVTLTKQGEFRLGFCGYAIAVAVNDNGCMMVSSGGTAVVATVNSNGSMIVNDGGVMIGLTINNGGVAKVNGMLNAGLVRDGGMLEVLSHGTVSNVTINSRGNMAVNGGSATATIISGVSGNENDAIMTVFNGGTLDNTTISFGGMLGIQSGGIANSTTVENGGRIEVDSGGIADCTTIESGGTMLVNRGRLGDTIINGSGSLIVSSSLTLTGKLIGTAGSGSGTKWKPVISFANGASLNFDLTQTSPNESVRIRNYSYINGSPTFSITVKAENQAEGVYLLAGDISSFNGTITVKNENGVELGTLSVGESIRISKTKYSLLHSSNSLSLIIGDDVTPTAYTSIGLVLDTKSATIQSGQVFKDTLIRPGGTLIFESGGIADGTIVESGGWVLIDSGGVMSNTTYMADAGIYASSSVEVCKLDFIENGTLHVLDGGVVSKVTFHNGGDFWVSSGGTATDVMLDSRTMVVLKVTSGTYVTGGIAGSEFILEDGVLRDFSLESSYIFIESDGMASNTVLGTRGFLQISAGGAVCNTELKNSTTLHLSSGGKMCGKTIIESGAVVSAFSGSIIDFDLSSVSPDGDPLFTNLSLLKGKPSFTLTVTGTEEAGVYALANNASWQSIIVTNKEDDILGTLNASSSSVNVGKNKYTLNLTESALSLTVEKLDSDSIPPTVSNITANITKTTGQDVVVTAEFSDNIELASKLYRIGKTGIWSEYIDGVTVSENTTICFKALDTCGNESEIVSYEVANIDTAIPASGIVLLSKFRRVSSGRTLVDAEVSNGGRMVVLDGAVVDHTTIGNEGSMSISSGAVANNTTVKNDGVMTVFHGGMANSTTVNTRGFVYVSGGGRVNDIDVSSGGSMVVFGGATADSITIGNGTVIVSGGTANSVTINSAGHINVSSGGVVDNVVVSSNGRLMVSLDGKITGRMFFESDAFVSALNGAVIDFDLTRTSVGATIALLNDLSAISTADTIRYTLSVDATLGEGDYLLAEGVAEFDQSIAVLDHQTGAELGTLTVDQKTSVGNFDYTLNLSEGSLFVTVAAGCGGDILSVSLTDEKKGVTSGTSASDVTIDSGGCLNVVGGGAADNITVGPGGSMHIFSGGTADNINVSSKSRLVVSSGATATNIHWDPRNGEVVVEDGAYASFVSQYSGIAGRNQQVVSKNTPIPLAIMSGGTAMELSLIRGPVYVYSGGLMTDIETRNAAVTRSMFVFNGGEANRTTLNSGWSMYVSNGGVANNTVISSGGSLFVTNGGVVDNTSVVGFGFLHISSGGTANNTIVDCDDDGSWGQIYISSGGVLNHLSFNGGGRLIVGSGGILKGRMVFDSDTRLEVNSQSVVHFDLTQTSAGAFSLINNLSIINGKPLYVLTVDTNLAPGTYTYALADGANKFNSVISVTNKAGDELGTLSVGQTLRIGYADCTLKLVPFKSRLALTIVIPDMVAPAVSNICVSSMELTNQDVLVTADFQDDIELAASLYKLGDAGEWTAYADGVVVSENTTIYFKAVDAFGNESEIVSYEVANIDKLAPNPPVISADITGMTRTPVLVSAEFSEDSVTKEYSLDGENWIAYTDAILFTENGSVLFRGTDESGNTSAVASYEVTNMINVPLVNGPDDGTNNYVYDKASGLNKKLDSLYVNAPVEPDEEIFIDEKYSVELDDKHNFVGIGDAMDFAKITLKHAANLSFNLDATDGTKFTVWSLTERKDKKGNTAWAQKSLQSTTLKKLKGSTDYAATTKALLLNAGDYYVSMQSTNKKNGYALYNVTLSEASTFYTDGDNTDDWTDMKENGSASEEYATIGTITAETGLVLDNWVGFGDSVDYAQFHLDSASKLSFVASATDATKFTVYKLTQDKKGKWSLKSLQSTTLKKAKKAEDYTATTKGLLLESGEYYIAMESTNAKKGGSAYYTVELGTSTFYDAGDDGWNNYVYDKKAKEPMNLAEFVTTEINSGTTKVQLDLDPANEAWNNFVGFGDAADYALITLSADATLSFSLTATDAAKFTVYRLNEGKKAGSYTMKSLQATTLKKAKDDELFSAKTKALSLTEGEYFICMQSTNAAKGGSAFYSVELNHALCSGLPDAGIAMAMFDTTSERIFEESGKGMLAST